VVGLVQYVRMYKYRSLHRQPHSVASLNPDV